MKYFGVLLFVGLISLAQQSQAAPAAHVTTARNYSQVQSHCTTNCYGYGAGRTCTTHCY